MGINVNTPSMEGSAFERALKNHDDVAIGNNESKEWADMQNAVIGSKDKPSRKDCIKIAEIVHLRDDKEFNDKLNQLNITRPSKEEYYLRIAEIVSLRGTCIRRRFGAVIVKHDEIISTGYVGAPRGRENCIDLGYCWRQKHNIPSGQMYEKCRSVHAEMNAVISAGRSRTIDATLYLVGVENDGSYTEADCCSMCKRVLINSGITRVVFRTKSGGIREINVEDWIINDDSIIEHDGY